MAITISTLGNNKSVGKVDLASKIMLTSQYNLIFSYFLQKKKSRIVNSNNKVGFPKDRRGFKSVPIGFKKGRQGLGTGFKRNKRGFKRNRRGFKRNRRGFRRGQNAFRRDKTDSRRDPIGFRTEIRISRGSPSFSRTTFKGTKLGETDSKADSNLIKGGEINNSSSSNNSNLLKNCITMSNCNK